MPAPIVKKMMTRREKPTLLILCGLPGSGKSTFSTVLGGDFDGRKRPSWLRVSQDDVGSLDDCKVMIAKQLAHGGCVVLDRCNAAAKERQMFVREAKKEDPDVNIEVIYFSTPPDVCMERAMARRNHPTLDAEKAPEVIAYFAQNFKVPVDLREGPYAKIHVIDVDMPQAEIRALLHYFHSLSTTPS